MSARLSVQLKSPFPAPPNHGTRESFPVAPSHLLSFFSQIQTLNDEMSTSMEQARDSVVGTTNLFIIIAH